MVTDVHGIKDGLSGPDVPAMGQKVWSSDRQCHAFRLETRTRELAVMASLSLSKVETKGNRILADIVEEKRVKVRRVMAVRLEASRSIPEQDEGGRKPTGGLKQY